MGNLASAFLIAFSSTALSGCVGALLDTDPPEVRLRFVAAANSNEGAPLIVHCYELSGKGAFTAATYDRLLDDDQEELGKDMLNRDRVDFDPGQTWELERELDASTRYIGVFAAYRDPSRGQWRVIIETPPDETTVSTIKLGEREIELGETKQSIW
jgi:type VI secretion system protein VasD